MALRYGTSILALAAFVIAAFLSFAAMAPGTGLMQAGCPFSNSAAPCASAAPDMVLHHISAYQSFINVPVEAGVSVLALLAAICAVLAAIVLPRFVPILLPARRCDDLDPYDSGNFLRWLSLFEHSPSMS